MKISVKTKDLGRQELGTKRQPVTETEKMMARLICGVDEAGRGPLAGPVVAAAVVLEDGYTNANFRDSKALTAQQRVAIFDEVINVATSWAVIAVGPRRIEKINILQATRLAMKLAVQRITADLVLIDGNQPIECTLPQQTVVGGDALHVQISAASILAKVWRDRLMSKIGERFPGYGFEQHFGYGTPAHRASIVRLGPCRMHRRTFAGVKEHLQSSVPSCEDEQLLLAI